MTKQALITYSILSYCLLAFIPDSSAATPKTLTIEIFNGLHQCDKKFSYDVYLLGGKVGYLDRTISWDNNEVAAKAIVTSYGEVSFFWLDSTYQQQSTMQYSSQYKRFLTPSFSQKLTGLKTRKMTAIMSKNGLSSTVTLDDEVSQYQQEKTINDKGNNDRSPLNDIDTLGAQIRLNLLQGKTRFTLSRQASKKIETYEFEVVGNDIIHHNKWGKLQTTKVVERGRHNKMVLWFSSQHDHQLVKAQLDMMFSPVVWLSKLSTQCG
jgi:hypothetical protein